MITGDENMNNYMSCDFNHQPIQKPVKYIIAILTGKYGHSKNPIIKRPKSEARINFLISYIV